jgi:hypothetical protein
MAQQTLWGPYHTDPRDGIGADVQAMFGARVTIEFRNGAFDLTATAPLGRRVSHLSSSGAAETLNMWGAYIVW